MDKRIVITGAGVLASNAIGKDAFWAALRAGKSGVKPVSLFDTSKLRSKLAGEISDFKPEDILGQKGLRTLDRSTKLALAASKMAMDDAGISCPISEEDTDAFGVSLGSTLGSVWSISEFDKEGLREGPRSVNQALFPNTVINSPASQVSIRFNIQGFNSTISTGFCSGLDSIYYAMNMINLYDYKAVLAGAVEELCEQTYKGFHKIGHLAGSRPGKDEINCPFDMRRNGILFGEGAAMIILEELDHARRRGAHICAEVLGYGTSFDPKSMNICNVKGDGASRSIKACLEDSGLAPSDVDYICATADSTLDCDVMETNAVKTAFGRDAKDTPISSIKSMVGETFSASGAIAVAGALGVIEKGFIPPTINYKESDRRCDLDYVPDASREICAKSVVVNAFSPTGSNSSLAIGRFGG